MQNKFYNFFLQNDNKNYKIIVQQEKLELRRDLSALLGALSNMQRLMEVATDGKVIPLPPDVMEIGEKYSQRGEKYGRGSLAKGLSMPTGGG